MSVENRPRGTNQRGGNSHKRSKAIPIIILAILIMWLVFFWRCIDSSTAVWTRESKPGVPSAIVISSSLVPFPPVTERPNILTVTEYDSKYLRWAGQVKAGQWATWGRETLESPEIPIGGVIGPQPPGVIYGNIREMTGLGINLRIFDEENYAAWRSGKEDAFALNRKDGLSDFDYVLDISQGSYYIVLDNSRSTKDAFVGFTGVLAYVRPLRAGETPREQREYPVFWWDMKNEKLTIFEYILRLFKPPYSISQTPPSMSNK